MAMVLVVVMMLALGASVFAATGPLTVDQAKEIALRYTDVNAADAVFTKAYQTVDDGRHVYEIEFAAGNMKYEMDVDANTGSIDEFEKETFQRDFAAQNLTNDEAMRVALADAGLKAEDVRVKKSKMDEDDGQLVYEIEFYANGLEYEYSIDAQTCAITEKSVEKDD